MTDHSSNDKCAACGLEFLEGEGRWGAPRIWDNKPLPSEPVHDRVVCIKRLVIKVSNQRLLIARLQDSLDKYSESEVLHEPNWKHPKLQALLSENARRGIELMLVDMLLADPNAELADWADYEAERHAKLREKLQTMQRDIDEIAVFLIPGINRGPSYEQWRIAATLAIEHSTDKDLVDDLRSLLETPG